MSDDQNKKDYTKETDDFLAQFDKIYDKIGFESTGTKTPKVTASPVRTPAVSVPEDMSQPEKEVVPVSSADNSVSRTPSSEEEPMPVTPRVTAGRVSRLNEKKSKSVFSSLPFRTKKTTEKEERQAARDARRASGYGEKPEENKPVTMTPSPEKPVGVPAEEPVPVQKEPVTSVPAEPEKEVPADTRTVMEKISDTAAEVVAAFVLAHRKMHRHPEKNMKKVDRKALREKEREKERRIDEENREKARTEELVPDREVSSETMVIDSEKLREEQSRIDAERKDAMSEEATKKGKKKKPVKYRKNGKPKRHIFLKILIVLFCLGLLCCLGVGIWVMSIVKDTPDINPDNIYDMLSENTIIYDDSGEVLEYIYDSSIGLRTNLSYNEIPEDLVNAFVSIEDKTFWTHHGFNFIRIAGAIWDSLKTGDSISGTSTITQQLARNLYLVETKDVHSYVRKIQEAYYTLILERELSKEQIIEAYLNTIYLGQNSYGIYAAAQTYFSKEVSELTLAECALLASIPKNPYKNAPFSTYSNANIKDPSAYDIIYQDSSYTVVYKAEYRSRLEQVLYNMEEYGYISNERRQEALAYDLRAAICPSREKTTTISSYFADYVTSQVKQDLMNEYGITQEEAAEMLKTGGLRIYSTINVEMQQIAEDAFADASNFPTLVNMATDKDKNILNKDNEIMLYYYGTFFDADGNFTLKPDEYEMKSNGDMLVYRGNRLNFYKVTANGETSVQVEFKYLYDDADGSFWQMNGGVINIPSAYTSRDESGNLILSKTFFQDSNYKELFAKQSDGSYLISPKLFTVRQRTIQPQAAMVITDYHTGEIKTMVGGRSTTGKLLYNRALSTRQPGSSIKPFAVYGAALQRSYDLVNAATQGLSGDAYDEALAQVKAENVIFTPATIIDDYPTLNDIGEIWPSNSYTGYRGLYSFRRSVEQSVNVNAVQVQGIIGNEVSIEFAQRFGISSFVTDESKASNDMNPSALALGGMVNGVSTLEMASAYGTYANGGVYQSPICYTKVTNKMGDVLLEKTSKSSVACDEGVAFLMQDILRTTVTSGIAYNARISNQPVGGKTGTTSDKFDIWFDGFTPYYSASLWIGNDTNIELSSFSSAAAALWSKIMTAIHEDLETGTLKEAPSNIVEVQIDTQSGKRPSELTELDERGTVRTEYFLKGTEPTEDEVDDAHVYVDICTESGFLATDKCYEAGCVETVLRVKHPETSNLIYTGKELSDNFCLPMDYTYEKLDEEGNVIEEKDANGMNISPFNYPEDLGLDYEVTAQTRFTTIKYNFPAEVIDDILEKYGTTVTYKVQDYDYAAPVYYCYIHNTSPLTQFPIDPNIIDSAEYSIPDSVRRIVDPEDENYVGESGEVLVDLPSDDDETEDGEATDGGTSVKPSGEDKSDASSEKADSSSEKTDSSSGKADASSEKTDGSSEKADSSAEETEDSGTTENAEQEDDETPAWLRNLFN